MRVAHDVMLFPKRAESMPAEILKIFWDNFEQGIFRDGREQEVVGEFWAN